MSAAAVRLTGLAVVAVLSASGSGLDVLPGLAPPQSYAVSVAPAPPDFDRAVDALAAPFDDTAAESGAGPLRGQ